MDYKKQKNFFQKAYNLRENRIAAGYGWPLTVDPEVDRFFSFIKGKIGPHAKALDLGCGQGRHTFYFAEQGIESYGIDYIKSSVEEAVEGAKQRKLSNIHFQVIDLLKLNFPNNFFDVILDWSVLDHIHPDDWQRYLENILGVLKVDGYLLLTEFSATDIRIDNKENNFRWDRGSYDHYFREEELHNFFPRILNFNKLQKQSLGHLIRIQ